MMYGRDGYGLNYLSERLRELRSERKLRQRDVAEYLGITESAYGYYEQGRREPSYEALRSLAELYGVSIDYLLGHADKNEDKISKPLSTIGERIQIARSRAKLTTSEAAKRLELPESVVLSQERGESPVSEQDIRQYALMYKTPASYLNGMTNELGYNLVHDEVTEDTSSDLGLRGVLHASSEEEFVKTWDPTLFDLNVPNGENLTSTRYPDLAVVPLIEHRDGVDHIVGERYMPVTEINGHGPFFSFVVQDDCMTHDGIKKGMLVLVEPGLDDSEAIAVVVINGQMTLRRVVGFEGGVLLIAADSETPYIWRPRGESNIIKGQVKQVTWNL